MQIGIVVRTLIIPITIIFVHHLLSPLLTSKNQEQDDEAQQCGERDTNGRQGCSPPGRVVDTTTVYDSVVKWHCGSTVSADLYLWGIGRPA